MKSLETDVQSPPPPKKTKKKRKEKKEEPFCINQGVKFFCLEKKDGNIEMHCFFPGDKQMTLMNFMLISELCLSLCSPV